MIRVVLLVGIAATCTAVPVLIINGRSVLSHPAVLKNDAMEITLPDELRNDFYKNPRIVAALAGPSWFGYKEAQVTNRETDSIPRERIFHILRNAGLLYA